MAIVINRSGATTTGTITAGRVTTGTLGTTTILHFIGDLTVTGSHTIARATHLSTGSLAQLSTMRGKKEWKLPANSLVKGTKI